MYEMLAVAVLFLLFVWTVMYIDHRHESKHKHAH